MGKFRSFAHIVTVGTFALAGIAWTSDSKATPILSFVSAPSVTITFQDDDQGTNPSNLVSETHAMIGNCRLKLACGAALLANPSSIFNISQSDEVLNVRLRPDSAIDVRARTLAAQPTELANVVVSASGAFQVSQATTLHLKIWDQILGAEAEAPGRIDQLFIGASASARAQTFFGVFPFTPTALVYTIPGSDNTGTFSVNNPFLGTVVGNASFPIAASTTPDILVQPGIYNFVIQFIAAVTGTKGGKSEAGIDNAGFQISVVPEPSTVLLVLAGVFGFLINGWTTGLRGRRIRRGRASDRPAKQGRQTPVVVDSRLSC